MTQREFKRDGKLYNSKGGIIMDVEADDKSNKVYAVIVKCGHCGEGYYLPIMFQSFAKDIYTAIEVAKSYPRVKRDQKDVVIDAFEVSDDQGRFIKGLNDRDPYLRGYTTKDDKDIQSRRVLHQWKCEELLQDNPGLTEEESKRLIKTADLYHEALVLQKHYAHMLQGNKIIYPRRINQQEMLEEYLTQAALRMGVRKGNVFFMAAYYQIYGKNNSLGLVCKDKKFFYEDKKAKINYEYDIPEIYYSKLVESDVFTRDEYSEEVNNDITYENVEEKRPSARDKFRRRMAKHEEIKNKIEQQGSQPGDC